jgi:hypothetical protein
VHKEELADLNSVGTSVSLGIYTGAGISAPLRVLSIFEEFPTCCIYCNECRLSGLLNVLQGCTHRYGIPCDRRLLEEDMSTFQFQYSSAE